MNGIRRVLIFCALTALLPIALLGIPLYLRHNLYADVIYAVTESDILEMIDGVSTVFCSAQTLTMNGTFNAFQMDHRPEVTSYRKHIRLKKSMTLPDDTLEYWGFYLLRGATVALSVCSRFPGASILVVKGERSFSTCGMLDHNENKARTSGIYLARAKEQVKITFESNAREIVFEEPTKTVTGTRDASSAVPLKKRPRKHKEAKTLIDRESHLENEELATLEKSAMSYVTRHVNDDAPRPRNVTRKLRHARKHQRDKITRGRRSRKMRRKTLERKETNERATSREDRLRTLSYRLNGDNEDDVGGEVDDVDRDKHPRNRRSQEPVKPPALLDHGIQHGGNAQRNSSESSVSSFEEGLLDCYEGQVLLAREFEPSDLCTDVSYLLNGKHMQTHHDVPEDGYYYYIFYSDNDIVFNDIHALFDIYKPTFQYENVTESCVNRTECTFPLTMFSNDRVIVEVPTKDGIDHEQDDISLLVSQCRPRMGVYTIFPIAVLFLILCCAFM